MTNVLDTIDPASATISDGRREPNFINHTDYRLIIEELQAISLKLKDIEFVVHQLRTQSTTERSTEKTYTQTFA